MVGSQSTIPGVYSHRPAVNTGDSIASEGKGEYMYVEGRVLDIHGNAVPNASIETWENNSEGANLYGILYSSG